MSSQIVSVEQSKLDNSGFTEVLSRTIRTNGVFHEILKVYYQKPDVESGKMINSNNTFNFCFVYIDIRLWIDGIPTEFGNRIRYWKFEYLIKRDEGLNGIKICKTGTETIGYLIKLKKNWCLAVLESIENLVDKMKGKIQE